jgi:hypothetical protein
MRQPGEAVDANQVTLGALFDGRGDMVETDGALEEGEQGVGVDGPQLEVRLLH